jgi:exonuclease SbcC
MIPVKLELENFLCYRQPDPLDFSGIHVACLAGDNGAGKSSLLDAITWALWGRARARRDDELIHLGQEEMRVEFTFDLEGYQYRVLRQRLAGKRGRSVLDLQVADRDDGFRSISENTIRETQAKINDLLRLDYDTFVNSAFLLQGRADEFTLKTAGERKQILSDILGLSQWERYEERTKERLKIAERRIAVVEARLEEIEREVALEDRYRADLTAAQAEALRLSDGLRQAESRWREIETARQEMGHKQSQLADLSRRLSQREQELAAGADELAQIRSRIDGYQAVLARAEEITGGYQRWRAAREETESFNALLAQQSTLLERRAGLEGVLAEARSDLVARRSGLEQQVSELERRAAGAAVAGDLAAAQEELAELQQLETERDGLQTRLTELREEAGERRARNSALEAKGAELNERLDQLADVKEPRCPLCDQELNEAHRAELLGQLGGERETMREEWRENKARLKEVSDGIAGLRERLDRVNGELKRRPAVQRREAELAQRVADAQEAEGQLGGVRQELAQIQARLDQGEYAPETHSDLATVQAELDELGYDAEAHRRAQAVVDETATFESRFTELTLAEQEIAPAQETAARLEERQSRWEKELGEDQTRRKMLEETITELETQLADADQVQADVEDLRHQERGARMRLGAAQQRLDACQALKEQRKEHQEELAQLAEEQAIYEELRVAFGKKGVPAMIIEAAIPEIEESANALLTRMTSGRMHVRFETQREKVTGGVAETLDIQISDELGTRNYELYSGGEAFRINFGIRIALSKLLARRAGARLRSLVIDEGFGTQDAQGRERLVEAINAIQSDFDRIIVITHIDELKDAFPARIQVTKTPQGSQLAVV